MVSARVRTGFLAGGIAAQVASDGLSQPDI